MKYKIKLVCGYRKDQEYSIDADEAHKAYFLFLNPQKRGVFNNGLAVIGADIREIVPDYQGTMGWNPTHILDSDDWNELRDNGVDRKLRDILHQAKEIAYSVDVKEINKPLSKLIEEKQNPLLLLEKLKTYE